MIRTLTAAATFATLTLAVSALPAPASAQTYGQPVYLDNYGRPVGGTPLSEVETRSYVGTGYWSNGYSDRPTVYVPGPGYGHRSYGSESYGRVYDSYGYRSGYGHRRYNPPSRDGYRDEWGYNDDRPPSAQGGSRDRYARRHERDCGCADVYLYDR